MKQTIRIGLIGAGYWGVNLIRNFHRLGVLKAVSDNDKEKKTIQALAPGVFFTNNYKVILKDKTINAIVISTPAKSHFKMVKGCTFVRKTRVR